MHFASLRPRPFRLLPLAALLLTLLPALLLPAPAPARTADPIDALLERICPGASRKFSIERVASDEPFFELDRRGSRVVVRGNDRSSIAAGIHWYLKYYAGIQLSWDRMRAELPDPLPLPARPERRTTSAALRYAYNYCTYSYSMAFWDWERWEREIDWMALHGINLPLVATGMEVVWRDVLAGLGYDRASIDRFVAGPAFQAWWLMNNLEGWGGPCPEGWYEERADLTRRILARMRELDIEPVLPGYSGMLPADARERLGLDVADPGLWGSFRRPAFLQPGDPRFGEIADRYYHALEAAYGPARYFSCDPFHEGGSVEGVDLPASGRAILGAMKRRTADAAWVIQAWQANPRAAMIDPLPADDVIVLDLFSESRPQWGDPSSTWYRPDGYGDHPWIYCMLLNFGGNVGLHGKLDYVIDGYYDARAHERAGRTLRGVGITPEGIENNPLMYELLSELPWRPERFTSDEWLAGYLRARYGRSDEAVDRAWELLARSIYNCPKAATQEGTNESVFCARPTLDFRTASTWAHSTDYYDPADVIEAARLLLSAAEAYRGNPTFEYDLIDVVRQAVAEAGKLQQRAMAAAYRAGDREAFAAASKRFLRMISLQDRLLGTRAEFMVGRWIADARALGRTEADRALLEWNARVQISSWGDRAAAEGGLHDYAHKEWNGILRDLYAVRWARWFDLLERRLAGEQLPDIDFYAIEEAWARSRNPYPAIPSGDCIDTACALFDELFARR